MVALQTSIKKYASVFLFVLLLCFSVFAQDKFDLDIKVQPASETARGGETFSYIVTVSNIGMDKATNVIFIQFASQEAEFSSFIPSRGNCEVGKGLSNIDRALRCRVGNLEAGETVNTTVELKIREFGDASKNVNENQSLPSFFESDLYNLTAYIDVSGEWQESNTENNSARLSVELLPSRNIPPRLQIISPKPESSFTKPLAKEIEIPIIVKAFDVDGQIEKVVVSDNNNNKIQIVFEDNKHKYLIDGKTYTGEEIEERSDAEEFIKSFEIKAELTGKDTYTYVAKKIAYGNNRVQFTAIDNGGRNSFATLDFTVKSDSTIEIITPQENQLFSANSRIIVETVSKVANGITPKIILRGTKEFYSDNNPPVMKQISKVGNTYRHQFIWENAPEGIYDLQPVLLQNEKDTNTFAVNRIGVFEPRVIKTVSLKNNQIFDSDSKVEIKVEAKTIKGSIVYDKLEIMIDGKLHNTVINSLCESCIPNSYIWDLSNVEKGIHDIQIISKHEFGVKTGESEILKIIVK